jgi:hypothetical protein
MMAETRHGLGVVAGLIPEDGRLRLRLAVGCHCGWEVDEQSPSPQVDARIHVVEGRQSA